MFNETVKSY